MRPSDQVIMNLFRNKFMRHGLFWTLYLLTMTYIHGSGVEHGNYLPWFLNYLTEIPVLIGLTYTIAYILIKKLILRKKYISFAIYTLLTLFVFSFINVILDVYIIRPLFFGQEFQTDYLSVISILRNAFGMIFPMVIFVFILNVRNVYEAKRRKARIGIVKTQAQLDLLRNQVHPLFLRNSLQELYILSRRQAPMVSEMVLKISEILNYLIYECDRLFVRMENELSIIRSYLDFVDLRTDHNFLYNITEMGNARNFLISPYILFPLVRGVCEYHGSEGKQILQIAINVKEHEFQIYMKKEILETHSELYDTAWRDEVMLADKRLNLIYNFRHSLDIQEKENLIQVELRINTDNQSNTIKS